MSDELDITTKKTDDLDDPITDEVGVDDEKEITDDIDPSDLPIDEVEDLTEDPVVSPEEDPFGFGAFGELDEDGEYVAPAVDEDDEAEDEISEDLF
ncbi:MAG: hypothetical protein WCO09_02175 [bacterium]